MNPGATIAECRELRVIQRAERDRLGCATIPKIRAYPPN